MKPNMIDAAGAAQKQLHGFQGAIQNNGVGSTASCKSNTRAAPATPTSNPWPSTRSTTRSNNRQTRDCATRDDSDQRCLLLSLILRKRSAPRILQFGKQSWCTSPVGIP